MQKIGNDEELSKDECKLQIRVFAKIRVGAIGTGSTKYDEQLNKNDKVRSSGGNRQKNVPPICA